MPRPPSSPPNFSSPAPSLPPRDSSRPPPPPPPPAHPHPPRAAQRALPEPPAPPHRPAAGHHRLHEGDRAGVAEAAGRGDLRTAPGHAVPVPDPYCRRGTGDRAAGGCTRGVVLVPARRRNAQRHPGVLLGG